VRFAWGLSPTLIYGTIFFASGSLLQHYHLELHNLTPSGIMHITAFLTLCEDYMGIEPHFDRWNNFFRIRRPQDPNVELTISRGGVWLSTSSLGRVSILTSTSPCPNR
jgi:hypothetical protein